MQDRPLKLDNHQDPQHKTCLSRAIDHKKRLKCRIWLTPGAGVNLRLGKITGVGKAQIAGEARKEQSGSQEGRKLPEGGTICKT